MGKQEVARRLAERIAGALKEGQGSARTRKGAVAPLTPFLK